MNTRADEHGVFEFSFPRVNTLASVENRADEVLIRTSRNALTDERKAAFVRELASEGFIPDHYRWLNFTHDTAVCRVRWLVDPAWWMPGAESRARTSRLMVRVLAASALLWFAMMAVLLCGTAR